MQDSFLTNQSSLSGFLLLQSALVPSSVLAAEVVEEHMNVSMRARLAALIVAAVFFGGLAIGAAPAGAAENAEVTSFRRVAAADGWTSDEIEAVVEAAWGEHRFAAPVAPEPVAVTWTLPQAVRAPSQSGPIAAGNPVADLIRQVASDNGLGGGDANALVRLANRESRLNPSARSKTGKYLGLFQLDREMCGAGPWEDPAWNTQRAVRYIKARYGTPTKALNHSYSFGWY